MRTLPIFLTALLAAASALAAAPSTALTALKLLPRGELKHVARIEARDGTPEPDRWHILVFDKDAENGVHEYVVAGGEIVASRSISQFAETLTPDDLLGGDAIKIDSDRAAKILQEYAAANSANVTALSFSLRRDGVGAVPLWRVSGLDDAGKELGAVVVSAGKGDVISHEGFPTEPTRVVAKKEAFKPQARSYVAPAAEPPVIVAERAEPPPEENRRRPNVIERTGNTLQRFIFGRGR